MFSTRYIWAFLVIFFILLESIFKGIRIFGTRPDLILILVVFAGLSHGFLYGAGVGFASGLLRDIFLNTHLGLDAFPLTIIGFFAGLAGKRFFYQNVFIQVFIIFIATIIKMSITNAVFILIHHSPYLNIDVVSQAFFNALLTPPIFFLLCTVFKK